MASTVTGYSLSANTDANGDASSGTFTTSGPNNYLLSGSGIVISSGNAASDSSGPVIESVTTAYGVPATCPATQTNSTCCTRSRQVRAVSTM